MATTKKENYVDIFVDRDPGDTDPNVFIGINGKSYLLPKGETVKVPPEVKAEYERIKRAKEARYKNSDKLLQKAKEGFQL